MRVVLEVPAALVALAALLAVGCGKAGESGKGISPEQISQAREVAVAAADALVGTLQPELAAAMERGGTVEAIGICAERAQELTGEVESRFAAEGVRVRRTALRVRNPVNAPDAYEREWMESVGGANPAPDVAVVGTAAGDELRYLRPLITAELCVRCHGLVEQIDPTVREVIGERYPADQATGFVVGEMRGIISVLVPLE